MNSNRSSTATQSRHRPERGRRTRGGVLVAAATLVFAACGDSSDTETDSSTPVGTTATSADQTSASVPSTSTAPTTDVGADSSTTASPSSEPSATSAPAGVDAAAWDEIVAAAKEEGSLMFYTVHVPALVEPLGEAFEKEYGIEFEYVRNTGPDLIAAVEAELSTGQGIADVVGTPDLVWLAKQDSDENWVSLADLPNVHTEDFQPDWLRGNSSYLLEAVYANGWGYNEDLYPGGPSSCDDILAPELVGLVGIIDPTYPEAVDQLVMYEDQCGEGFLEKLGEMQPRIYSGSLPMVESLASGETVVNMNSSALIQANLVAQGAPLAVFQEPWNTRVIPTWAAAVRTAPHPNAALVFTNFVLSREANEARGGWPSQLDSVRGIPGHQYAGDFEFRDPSQLSESDIADYQARFDAAMR